MKLTFNSTQHGYDVVVKNGALASVGKLTNLRGRVAVVCDDKLDSKIIKLVAKQCEDANIIKLETDMNSTGLDAVHMALKGFQAAQLKKGDVVLALGGNFICQVAGFAAKIWQGGTPLCLVPATLAAQTGNTINGLHNLNMPNSKDALTLMHKPCFALIDPALADAQFGRLRTDNGFAYILGVALAVDSTLFEVLETEGVQQNLERIITLALLSKKQLVDADETFSGQARLLQFGSTVGNAIQSALNFEEILPGEALALGMLPLIESRSLLQRTKKLMKKLGLPTKLPLTAEEIMPYIQGEQSAEGEWVQAVRAKALGKAYFENIAVDELKLLIEDTYR